MLGCPFSTATDQTPPPASDELAFLAEVHTGAGLADRIAVCRAALAAGEPAPLTSAELTWAGRVAWRNHARCIGRLYWRTLAVRDERTIDTADGMIASLLDHVALAQADGTVRSVMTVFAPPERAGGPAPRIWNHQLCGYAGYRGRGGAVRGDPKNVALTEQALALGWEAPAEPGAFDLLPWIVAGRNGPPQLFRPPAGLLREVGLRHPDLPWFEGLGLRWYAVPVVTDLRLRAAGTDYPAAPFNGWYMGTEIARNLADTERYNLLPLIADKLGLDRRSERTLWKDRALLELNVAVLHSFGADGVRLVDHHTASVEFMKFCEREKSAGRDVSARWDWIVPPMSPSTTQVFHTPMREFPTTPDFHAQPPAWSRG